MLYTAENHFNDKFITKDNKESLMSIGTIA